MKMRTAFVFIIALLFSLLADTIITIRYVNNKKQLAVYVASGMAERMRRSYDKYNYVAQTMSFYLTDRRVIPDSADKLLDTLYRNFKGIKSMQYIRHGAVAYAYPQDSGVIGFNMFADPGLKEDSQKAINSGRSIISDSKSLMNMGEVFILNNPIYLTKADGDTSFWGFSTLLIDTRQFFSFAEVELMNRYGFSFQIWTHEPYSDKLAIDGVIGTFNTPQTKDFELGNKSWSILVEPKDGWFKDATLLAYLIISIVIAVMLTMLDYFAVNMVLSNKALKEQAEHLASSENSERLLRSIYESCIESAELFLWEVNLLDESAILMHNPYTNQVSRELNIPSAVQNLYEYMQKHTKAEDKKVLETIVQRLRKGEKSFSEILHFAPKGNTPVFTVRATFFVQTDEYNKPVKVYCTGQDITELNIKKGAYEQELAFFNSYRGKNMVQRLHVDLSENKILDLTPATGSQAESSYENYTKFGSYMNFIVENNKTTGELFERQTLLRKFTDGTRAFSYEFKTGSLGTPRSWVRADAKLINSPENSNVEMFFYVYDISNEKNEQVIMNRIIDFVYEKIGIIDLPTGRYRAFPASNDETADNGVPYDDFISNVIALHYIPEDYAQGFIAATKTETLKKELAVQGSYTYTTPFIESGGTVSDTQPTKYKLIRFCYMDDSHSSILFCVSDVTNQYEREQSHNITLKNALAKAESANRAKTEFLSRISHDIRTPIGAIQNLTVFAKNDVDNKDKLLHDLAQIETSNKFLLSLINDVLDISKLDKGQLDLVYEPYEYKEFMSCIKNIMEPLCLEKGLHWQAVEKPGEDGGAVIIDKIRLNQIALNILSNAVKFTPECGDVTYTSCSHFEDDGTFMLSFEVSDTGIGMSEEFQQHMFEEFSQEYANSQRPKGITGTGLGLALANRMIKLMNGTISVKSRIGIGTTVQVSIPCEFKSASQLKLIREKNEYEQNSTVELSGKVLLAEDNEINTEIAKTVLDNFGCTVDHAENGKEAVELFAFSKPGEYSIILMDIQMPFMDGYEATRRIRALNRADGKTIPIVALTADAFDDAREKAFAAGVNAYLTKPLNPTALKHILLDL